MKLRSQCKEARQQPKWISNSTISPIFSNKAFPHVNTRCFQVGVSSAPQLAYFITPRESRESMGLLFLSYSQEMPKEEWENQGA